MSHRFYLPQLESDAPLVLDGDQAHHALQVMRFGVGDTITLFDGQGIEYRARIESIGKRRLELQRLERIESDSELPVDLSLAVALPKGDRQKWLVEKLVELGVRRLIPLETERGVAAVNPKVRTRLEKQVIEASKQCHRNRLISIEPAQSLETLVAWAQEALPPEASTWIGDPRGGFPAEQIRGPAHLILIGPEGGFSEEELERANNSGAKSMSLGPAVLRVETAALAAAAIVGRVAMSTNA